MSERRPLTLHSDAPPAQSSAPKGPDIADLLLEAYFDPRAAQIARVVEMCRALLFPGYAGPDIERMERTALHDLVRVRIEELRAALHRQVYRALHHRKQQVLGRNELECSECTRNADAVTDRF